ncbi:HlyD family secretion protein [Amphritea atlantica]|uniref:HlyD family secretion protein n=1 Tax=Amphritea atlantica TaxID=355243 RepID=A0A1H9KU60_9GAMM|nr:HlyD family efflux transporter periplasmic adaptor subunit [Amphritea atlantica]SER02696.1 HlyD family secretion protein [Amphritea atlantica]
MRYLICLILLFLTACDGTSQNLALGTLERDRIAHTATASEVVVELPVAAGSQVSRGTVLVKLDSTLQQAEVDKATAEVARAEANLEKLRNGAREEEVAAATARVAGARASLVESRSNYNRILNLKKQKLVSQSDLDRARSARDAAQAGLESAQEALRLLTNGTREEDLRAAEASLHSAQATLAIQTKRLADLTIIATRDGILDNLPWNLGERVTIGSPLAIILAGTAPHARVYVPEPYRVKLHVGDSLIVHVDGIEQPITGKLSWIATEPAFTPYYALNQEERARLMYLAEVKLPDSEADLPNGVPAQVELP